MRAKCGCFIWAKGQPWGSEGWGGGGGGGGTNIHTNSIHVHLKAPIKRTCNPCETNKDSLCGKSQYFKLKWNINEYSFHVKEAIVTGIRRHLSSWATLTLTKKRLWHHFSDEPQYIREFLQLVLPLLRFYIKVRSSDKQSCPFWPQPTVNKMSESKSGLSTANWTKRSYANAALYTDKKYKLKRKKIYF